MLEVGQKERLGKLFGIIFIAPVNAGGAEITHFTFIIIHFDCACVGLCLLVMGWLSFELCWGHIIYSRVHSLSLVFSTDLWPKCILINYKSKELNLYLLDPDLFMTMSTALSPWQQFCTFSITVESVSLRDRGVADANTEQIIAAHCV